jgi:hypothetical protein
MTHGVTAFSNVYLEISIYSLKVTLHKHNNENPKAFSKTSCFTGQACTLSAGTIILLCLVKMLTVVTGVLVNMISIIF